MLKWLGRHVCPLYRKVQGNQANQSYWRTKDRARNKPMGGNSKNGRWADMSGAFNCSQVVTHFAHPFFLTTSTSIQSRMSP